MDRYIGKLLDNRYEIQEIIGTGGMAVVYKALCHRLNRPVAVKILKDEMFQDAEFRRRFHAESQAVAMMSHPNIVSVYDVSHTDDADYIVMELIDGISLKQYMEQKPVLNWREVLHFSIQICKALEHAHSRGIIHRDIKPHNIMLLKDGSVKVADFGIARITSAQSTLTREALGSVHYISPEQAKGGKIDCRADLYSLGVVMYEMLTGRPPFDGDTPVSVAIQHINAKATLPREINPAVPEGLEQITMRAMEADLPKRYPSASQLLQDMESFRQDPAVRFALSETAQPDTGEQPAQPKEERRPRQRKKNRRGAAAVAIGIACLVLAVAGFAALLVRLVGDSFKSGEDVTVPNLYLAEVNLLEETYGENFEFEVDFVPHDEIAYGLVVSQDPKADMTVKKGATISVTASSGSQQNSMPNLVNYSLKDAQDILSRFDVIVSVKYEASEVYVKDFIIRTEPEYGTVLQKGQKVVLVVSEGDDEELIPVPALVGMDETEATAIIEDLGLKVGNIKYVESDLPAGTVTFQSVDQDKEVKEGTAINLHVAEGADVDAALPVIVVQPASVTVDVHEAAALAVSATVNDEGALSYEWFASSGGGSANLTSVGTGTTFSVPTDTVGSYEYCCKVTNTLGESTASVYTNMVTVTVREYAEPVTKTLEVTLPAGDGPATIVIKLDGQNHMTPFTVERTEGTIEIALESTGSHHVEVLVDGNVVISRTVDFTE